MIKCYSTIIENKLFQNEDKITIAVPATGCTIVYPLDARV